MVMIKIGCLDISYLVDKIELFQSTLDNSIYFKIGMAYVKFSEFNFKAYNIFKEKIL